MSGPPPAPQKRTPGEARHESWETIQVMFWDTLPFLAAAVLVGVVHTVREVAMPDNQATWMRIVEGALLTSEVVLFVSLVIVKAFDVLGELGEAVGILKYRTVHSWRTGTRAPRAPRL